MAKPEKHVFICTQNRPPEHPKGSCAAKGCQPVVEEFAAQFDKRGLFGRMGLTTTGCLGVCDTGPAVLVYPEGVMYGNVGKDDVNAIIDEHLLGGAPVERLKVSEEIWG